MKDYVRSLRSKIGTMPIILPGAGVIVTDHDGRILLLHRSDNGLWCLPGGMMEPGEAAEATARRELQEETGLVAGPLQLFGVFSGPELFYVYPNGDQVHNVSVVFKAESFTGDPRPDGDETLSIRFFSPAELPPLSPPDQPALHRYVTSLK